MNGVRDETECTYVTIPKWITKDFIYDALLESGSTPHAYDGVDDVLDVLSRMNFRNVDDFVMEVDWMIEERIDDSGYLVVPDKFISVPPIPVWWDY